MKQKKIDVISIFVGLLLIVVLSIIAVVLSQLEFSKNWGLEYVLWAVILGLIVRNTVGIPEKFKTILRTEIFIKIGLVLLGSKILFGDLLAYGIRGMVQAFIVVSVVFFIAYYISRRLGLKEKFAHILAAGVSICGVSAAIATSGAIGGDKKELTYVISMVVTLAIPMLLSMPILAKLFSFSPVITGAWIGGVIDTTPAVVAAATIAGPEALKVAAVVKMSQNVLIGVVAFLLAVYYVFKVDKRIGYKPKPIEIWYRFPKFILGFIIVSILASLSLFTKSQLAIIGNIQNWLFALAFVCIGLNTSLIDFKKLGGKPFLAFIFAQLFNIIFTLIFAWILFG